MKGLIDANNSKENNIDVTCQDMGIEETDKLCEDGIRM